MIECNWIVGLGLNIALIPKLHTKLDILDGMDYIKKNAE